MHNYICALTDSLTKCINGQSQQFSHCTGLSNHLCQCFCDQDSVRQSPTFRQQTTSLPLSPETISFSSQRSTGAEERRRPSLCHCHALARHVWRVEGFYTEKRCLASSVANPPRNAWSSEPSLAQYCRLVVYFRQSSASLITGEPQCPSLISGHWYLMEDGPASSVD